MSELRTDTITASDGTSPVTLTKQSAAKAWCDIAANPVAFRDSFGMSSSSDIAVGNYNVSFTNSFSNAYYAPAGNTSTASFSTNAFTNRTDAAEKTTSLYEWSTSNGNSAYDLTFNTLTISGDLA